MKPSCRSSSARSAAARSRYSCLRPGAGITSKMTAIMRSPLQSQRRVGAGAVMPVGVLGPADLVQELRQRDMRAAAGPFGQARLEVTLRLAPQFQAQAQ